MKVLGIETSTMMGSIGLIDNGRPVALFSLNIEVTHSERLLRSIDILLKGARVTLETIDGFAISIGPGSFTGLRIGLGVVKGLVIASGKPLVAVSTLEALAANIPFSLYTVCPVLDARKKEVYAALFEYNKKGAIVRKTEDMVLSPERLTRMIRNTVVFLGDGVHVYKNLFIERLGDRAMFAPSNIMLPSGISVAGLGLEKMKRGEIMSPSDVPIYIRKSEAEIKYKERGHRSGVRSQKPEVRG